MMKCVCAELPLQVNCFCVFRFTFARWEMRSAPVCIIAVLQLPGLVAGEPDRCVLGTCGEGCVMSVVKQVMML